MAERLRRKRVIGGLSPAGKRLLTAHADVADRDRGRLNWAESAPTGVASGRTGVRSRSCHSIAGAASDPADRFGLLITSASGGEAYFAVDCSVGLDVDDAVSSSSARTSELARITDARLAVLRSKIPNKIPLTDPNFLLLACICVHRHPCANFALRHASDDQAAFSSASMICGQRVSLPVLERSEIRLNSGDFRIRRVLIQPAGWMEASRNGRTLLSGFARPCD